MYPSEMAQNFWTAIWAFSTNFVLTVIISFLTKPRPEPELVGLVYSLTPKPVEHHMAWYARPKIIAVGLIAMLIALNLIFK
jgi:SSS family solute:Na+ symporter